MSVSLPPDQERCEELRRKVQLGLDEARRGEVAPLDLDAIKAKGREILRLRKADR